MKYGYVADAVFLQRPNRFIAQVLLHGQEETVHVKNTGRCKELLVPGAKVYLEKGKNPARKTAWDLIAVEKGDRLINMDSQLPNKVAEEWLAQGGFGHFSQLFREQTWGASRLDFCLKDARRTKYVEVKGVTLEEGGKVYFPDAPTARGVKHLEELTRIRREGMEAAVLFVVQMKGVSSFSPNDATDPAFGDALRRAKDAGVEIAAIDCLVRPEEVTPGQRVPVVL
ncbi:MAG TPA: DNA/RNA nuclease SfsA [Candidatus Egerieicola faecale]|uniref:Sugar fermentation stimulation protein homolog n=1 Tax=Candidatus Egerieicola faecale TaxID=2840774 RepID=A0A9D1IQJ9_9FIRM|nr:DNA/RNA nuclease SfsA [Candidatus Egerieicola faecale]